MPTLSREDALTTAAGLARGNYQAGLVGPRACWSGADLKGKARDYGRRYAQSRNNFAVALENALGDAFAMAKGPKGRALAIYGTRFVAAYRANAELFDRLKPGLNHGDRGRLRAWLHECAEAAEHGRRQPSVPAALPPRAQIAEMAR